MHLAIRSLELASRLVPGGGNCFVRALALRTLLMHRGIVTDLYVGFITTPTGEAQGHAWLEHGERVLVGDIDGLRMFRRFSSRY